MMPPIAFSRHLRSLLAVPFLAVMLAFPASAQPDPNPANPEAGQQSESKQAAGQAESNPADPPAESNPSAAQTEPDPAPQQPKQTVLINVDKGSQEMTVFVDGVEQYSWPVSTGMRGYSTPSGTYTPGSMNEIWYSKQWDDAPMPHAVFFTKKGHAIHGSSETKRLGTPASHGCVRLAPENATTLFELVKATGLENVQVVLSGTTPGGEGPKVASPGYGSQPNYGDPWFGRGDYYRQQPQKQRRGLFGRRWFQPDGPQGYYGPPRGYQPRGVGPRPGY
jgi:lipoprotein-anchoring transpeptidase ErfK/SrfK